MIFIIISVSGRDMALLSELRQHLGTEPDICYPLRKKKVKETPPSMNCPYCTASMIRKRTKKTELGYATFCCSVCRRTFNERTGTPFNYLEVPTDVVFLVVLWRLRYKLSLRDVAEMFLERGFVFTHETVRDWEARFAPLMADQLRTRTTGTSWEIVVCR
jgi:transposase-like protein